MSNSPTTEIVLQKYEDVLFSIRIDLTVQILQYLSLEFRLEYLIIPYSMGTIPSQVLD